MGYFFQCILCRNTSGNHIIQQGVKTVTYGNMKFSVDFVHFSEHIALWIFTQDIFGHIVHQTYLKKNYHLKAESVRTIINLNILCEMVGRNAIKGFHVSPYIPYMSLDITALSLSVNYLTGIRDTLSVKGSVRCHAYILCLLKSISYF